MAEISLTVAPDRVKTGLKDGSFSEEDVRRYLARKEMEKGIFKMEPQQVKEAHKLGYMTDQQTENYINFKEHPVMFTISDSVKGIGYGIRNAAEELNRSYNDLLSSVGAAGHDPAQTAKWSEDNFEGANAQTGVGGFVEGTSQFMTGFVPGLGALSKLSKVGKLAKIAKKAPKLYTILEGLIAGAPVDALLFDPKEPRLSNFVEEYPALRNPVTDYLKAGPDDSNAEGRFKNAIEGAFIGATLDSALAGFKVLKGRLWKKHSQRADNVAQEIDTNIDTDSGQKGEGQSKGRTENVEPDAAHEVDSNPVLEDLGEQPVIEIKKPPFIDIAASYTDKDLAEQVIKISRGLDSSNPREVDYFNIDKIESTDQVKSIIAEMVNREPELAPRSLKTTERLSRLMGGSSEDLIKGMRKLYGETKNLDVKIKAYHDFFTSYETVVHKLAKEAKSDAEYLKVVAHMQQAQELMRMMKGIQVGTARGLNAHKLSWRAKKFDFESVPNLREEIEPDTLKKVKQAVDNYSSIADQEGRDLYNRNLGRNRFWTGLLEMRQASLVANPGTWGVNIIGNAGAQAFEMINRSVVTAGRSLVDPRRLSQYGAMYHGLMQGLADSFRLHGLKEDGLWQALKSDKSGNVWNTIRTGDPQLDARTKYGEDGKPFESVLGPMSFVTQIGFRPLTIMDEFFKTVGYHMEKHYRGMDMALTQTPKGGNFRALYKDLVTEMPEEIHQSALRYARETSYQLPLSPRMQGLKKFIDIAPVRILFLPFYNVAINIVKFATERTPLGLASKKNWQTIRKGGSEALEVVNRITMGTGLMAFGSWMYEQGMFLGSFEKSQDPAMRNAGLQQFSLVTKSGKTVSLNRLDPIVTWLGMGADISRIYSEIKMGDREAEELFSMMIASTAELLTDKSFLKGIHDLVNLLFAERNPEKWAKRTGGNLLPGAHMVQWVKGQFFEDTRRQIYSYMDALKKNFNQGLLFAKRHAVTGKPIKNIPRSMGMFNVTEIAKGEDRALLDMARCGAAMRPMKQEIRGAKLDGKQYDRLQGILSELPVMSTLNAVFDTPQFKTIQDDEFKAETYRRIVNKYRGAARAMYLSEDPGSIDKIKDLAIKQALAIGNEAVAYDPQARFLQILLQKQGF